MAESFWFDGWNSVARTATVGLLSYLMLLLILRAAGKRTISKMNAYDFIVTIALGSTLASALTSDTITLADAGAAFLILAGLQYIASWLSVRIPAFRGWVTNEPTLLLLRGEMLTEAMRRERITEAELISALRGHGVSSIQDAGAVVLETDGSFNVVPSALTSDDSVLRNIPGFPSLPK